MIDYPTIKIDLNKKCSICGKKGPVSVQMPGEQEKEGFVCMDCINKKLKAKRQTK